MQDLLLMGSRSLPLDSRFRSVGVYIVALGFMRWISRLKRKLALGKRSMRFPFYMYARSICRDTLEVGLVR